MPMKLTLKLITWDAQLLRAKTIQKKHLNLTMIFMLPRKFLTIKFGFPLKLVVNCWPLLTWLWSWWDQFKLSKPSTQCLTILATTPLKIQTSSRLRSSKEEWKRSLKAKKEASCPTYKVLWRNQMRHDHSGLKRTIIVFNSKHNNHLFNDVIIKLGYRFL